MALSSGTITEGTTRSGERSDDSQRAPISTLAETAEIDKEKEDARKVTAEDQKKLADEMRRKAEQGSTQLQGEVQELALEEMLKASFPFDVISEVGKGIRGADCIQTVRNNLGQECGKIIYESKRRENFSIKTVIMSPAAIEGYCGRYSKFSMLIIVLIV